MLNHEEFVWGYNYIPQQYINKDDGKLCFVADTSLGEEGSVANEVNIRKSDINAFTYFTGTIKNGDGTFKEECMVKIYMNNGTVFYLVDSEDEFVFDNIEQ